MNDLELRCFCRRRPLLAIAGRDPSGDAFIHLKVYRQQRIYAEMIAEAPSVLKLRCRECLRWHTVRIRRTDVSFQPTPQ